MTCYLLHIMQEPDQAAYADPDVKDVVGDIPKFYCAHCNPIKRLRPGEAVKCLNRDLPCWKPLDRICED